MSMFQMPASRNLAFKAEHMGVVQGGTILEIGEPQQATKYTRDGSQGAPDFWDDEKTRPKMQVKITLQTTERDGSDSDDGKRGLYVLENGKPGGMLHAIRTAVVQAGQDDLQVGAKLELVYTSNDPESANPDNPRKLYEARYTPPASGGGMFGGQAQQGGGAAAPAGQQAPVAQQSWGQPQGGGQPGYGQHEAPAAQQGGQQGWGQQQQQAPQAQQQAQGGQQSFGQQWGQQQGGQGPAPTDPAANPAFTQQAAQQPPAAAQGPSPDVLNNVRQMIGMGLDDATIVGSLADPTLTTQVVAGVRAQG